MKRNAFGDPQPSNYAEMVEALDECDTYAVGGWATVSIGDEGGWYASVLDNEDGNELFETVEYQSKDELLKDLETAGIDVP